MNMKYLFCSLLVLASVSACAQPSGAPAPSSVSLAPVVVPALPQSLEFAGEAVPLDNYDTRESLLRELMSCMYLHSRTTLTLLATTRYFPVIEPIMKKYGIPDDFKYLCMAESGLDPNVRSGAGAAGLWQLMPVYAKSVGLLVGGDVDERYDVTKATEAACRYLKAAYDKYGDWATVAASYNAGMGRISGELTKQEADSSFDLWLVEETTRYVYRIMAIKQIFEAPYKYGFVLRAQDLYKPIACENVSVSTDIQDLSAFAQKNGATYADLKRFNPWLRDRKLLTLGKTYTLQIPKESDMYYKTPNTYVHNPAWVVK